MVGLEESILVGTELLKLGFEKFLFVICDLFFVEDKNIRNVIVVNLERLLAVLLVYNLKEHYFVFQVL